MLTWRPLDKLGVGVDLGRERVLKESVVDSESADLRR